MNKKQAEKAQRIDEIKDTLKELTENTNVIDINEKKFIHEIALRYFVSLRKATEYYRLAYYKLTGKFCDYDGRIKAG